MIFLTHRSDSSVCFDQHFSQDQILPLRLPAGGTMIKNLPVNAGDLGLIPGSRRSPGERKGNPLQYSYLGNPMGRGAWWATYSPWGHKVLGTTDQLSIHACTIC